MENNTSNLNADFVAQSLSGSAGETLISVKGVIRSSAKVNTSANILSQNYQSVLDLISVQLEEIMTVTETKSLLGVQFVGTLRRVERISDYYFRKSDDIK